MTLTTEQKFIRKRMLAGAITGVIVLLITWYISPFIHIKTFNDISNRWCALVFSITIAILPMIIMIGALAGMRFFSSAIDGSNNSLIENNVKVLNNTHEQTILFIIAINILAISIPNSRVAMFPLLAIVFMVGRILFWKGYKKNNIARAYGFATNFYTSLLIILFALIHLIFLN